MKKLISKLSVGLIFLIFGFVIITQLKTIEGQDAGAMTDNASPEILLENEQLKKEKTELQSKIDEIAKKVEEYESAAVNSTESELLAEELKKTKIRAGLTDVEGPGVVIYINPKTTIFGTGTQTYNVMDTQLLRIVNELYASGAEAVSINDIRLINSTGIRSANDNTSLYIGNERISPQAQIVIKAIGSKSVLTNILTFPAVIPEDLKKNCEVVYEGKDSITINKSNAVIKYEYIKEVQEK